jgi:tyrosyl-tRNA synthetase
MDISHQLEQIKRGAVELISEGELINKLKNKKRLHIKLGLDPTAPDLHLGHTVVLQKLRHFQDLGHIVYLVIGDYTARIGDPSGQSVTRPSLSKDQVKKNAATYTKQAFKVLKKSKTKVVFNSKWLGRMSGVDFIKLAASYNVARMLERDDFEKRHKAGEPIRIHEFIYPLLQGYDSVVLKADVEIGGTDQKFNLLVGRDLQREFGQEPQVVLTLPLLVGTDGVMKMSKSCKNYIGISEPPNEIFGKVMSISDDLMWTYYELLSCKDTKEIGALKRDVEEGRVHPKAVKESLAMEMVARFHNEQEAKKAKEHFDRIFVKKLIPEQVEEKIIEFASPEILLVQALAMAEAAPSKSEIRRVIQQGGLSLNGEKVTDINAVIKTSEIHDVKFGKRRFMRIKFNRV